MNKILRKQLLSQVRCEAAKAPAKSSARPVGQIT